MRIEIIMEEYDNGTYFLLSFAWGLWLLFLILKLFTKVDWNWFIVFSPLIISVTALLIMKVISALLKLLFKIKHKNKGV